MLRRWLAIVLVVASPLALSAQRPARDLAALVKGASEAMAEQRFGDALEAFTAASKLEPRDPSICVAAGVAAFRLGQNDDAEAWFTRALKTDPAYVSASAWLGELQYREGRVGDAIGTYEAALKRSHEDPTLERRLEDWRKEAQLQDRFYQSHGAHFDVLFEGPTDDALGQRVVERLEADRLRIGAALTAYPSTRTIVVLYTAQQFRDITRMPNWSGGAYDGRIRIPVRGAVGKLEELDRVLAHEYVHAVVASLAGHNVPVWLNEGLATSFEPDGGAFGDRVLATVSARPRLAELEHGFSALTSAQALVAYAFSVHAVKRMLQFRGASSVVLLLQDLGQGVPFAEAFHQRMGMTFDEFQGMVAHD